MGEAEAEKQVGRQLMFASMLPAANGELSTALLI